MSVNFGKVDPRSLIGTGKVGLLTSSGTYDVERYPWAYDCWKRQQQTHWMGEEVPLGADIKDWQSGHMTDAEKALLTQIFRFFTQSDVEVGDNYLKRYIPIFQPLEVQMMMAAFTNMETVHIDAYALLLKTLGMPQAEFEAFRDYDEMRAKAGVPTDPTAPVDPDQIKSVVDYVTPKIKKTIVNVISKSGETAETASQFVPFSDLLRQKLGKRYKENVLATTDPEGGTLRKLATEEGFRTLEVPPGVGGRFSVLSAVGLFSAAMCGIDIEALTASATGWAFSSRLKFG